MAARWRCLPRLRNCAISPSFFRAAILTAPQFTVLQFILNVGPKASPWVSPTPCITTAFNTKTPTNPMIWKGL